MEEFVIRLNGNRSVDILVEEGQYPWPLPGIIPGKGGSYFKQSDSGQFPGNRRGAIYEWRSDREG